MTAHDRHVTLGMFVLLATLMYVVWVVGGDGSKWVCGAYAAGVVTGFCLSRRISR